LKGPITSRISPSIHHRFTFGLLLIVVSTTLVFSGVLILYNFKTSEQKLAETLDSAMEKAGISLPGALWQFNHEYIQDYIDSLFLNEDFVFASVSTGQLPIKEKHHPRYRGRSLAFFQTEPRFMVREKIILHNTYPVGTLTLAVSRDRIKARLVREGMVMTLMVFLNVVTIFITTYILSKQNIFTPLEEFSKTIRSISHGNLEKRVPRSGVTEIDTLAEAFDQMLDHLNTTMASKQEVEAARQDLLLSVKEKEVLLREIHHRVKNNMQIIQSLLNLQAGKTDSQELKASIQDANQRIKSMALIHETLYRSADLVRLDLPRYFGSIISYLERIYRLPDVWITIQRDIHPVKLGMDHSIACGLILNELVTNALKYAFAGMDNGVIRIRFIREAPNTAAFTVSDNGCGTPEMFDKDTTDSLGLQLVRMLAEDQLEGELTITRGTELEFTIRFPLTKEE